MSIRVRLNELKNNSIIVTKEILEADFQLLNDIIFMGELDTPKLKVKPKHKMVGAWGYQLPNKIVMRNYYANALLYLNVLAHEMVHLWQDNHFPNSRTHGKHFLAWNDIFKANGLILNKIYTKKKVNKIYKKRKTFT